MNVTDAEHAYKRAVSAWMIATLEADRMMANLEQARKLFSAALAEETAAMYPVDYGTEKEESV